MPVESKVKLYKAIIRPIMAYRAQTCAETVKTEQLLRIAEIYTLRTIIEETRLNHGGNENVRQ